MELLSLGKKKGGGGGQPCKDCFETFNDSQTSTCIDLYYFKCPKAQMARHFEMQWPKEATVCSIFCQFA